MEENVSIQRRVERMVRECRALVIEPDSIAMAEIMVDDHVAAGKCEEFSPEWRVAWAKYEKAAARHLGVVQLVGHREVAWTWGERKEPDRLGSQLLDHSRSSRLEERAGRFRCSRVRGART